MPQHRRAASAALWSLKGGSEKEAASADDWYKKGSLLGAFLVPSDVLFSNSMLEDMEKIWALRDIIPDPNCFGQKT
jgi:hypothetical protein